MRPFAYASPTTIDEAIALLARDETNGASASKALAGGTDLLTLMKGGIVAPSRLVDIKRVLDLDDTTQVTPDGLTIGALATLAELETHPLVKDLCPALTEAAAAAASPQLRNMATIGGNLLQRPRCWYFRNARFDCWLKGGDDCPARDGENALHALFGGGPCYAVHPSDLATVLLAVDARARLRGPRGERTLPLAEFFALPEGDRRREHTVGDDDIILSITLPPLPAGTRSTYLKAMDRKVWAFALVAVAATLRVTGGRIDDARLVLGGVAPIPWRARAAEHALIGSEAGAAAFARAAEAAFADAEPLRHNAYKVPLAKALVRRALTALTSDAPTMNRD